MNSEFSTREAQLPAEALRFSISHSHDRFGALSDRARLVVKRRLRALRKIACAKSIAAGCRAVLPEFGNKRGFSAKRIYQLYNAYLKSGCDWTTLVDRAIAGPDWYETLNQEKLPAAFLDYLASEWALHQRDKFKAVHHHLVNQWRAWTRGYESNAIPGYPVCPQADASTGLPVGWTYENLLRAVKPRVSKFSRKLVQVGPKAAMLAHSPHIISTRAGTAVGEYYIVDDSWNDFKVLAFGQTVRLLAFHILDLASGCNVKRGYKPALTNERDAEERLREREMIWLFVAHLTTNGYRQSGTTFICEKATGTIRETEAAILHDFGLPIKVDRGPRGGGPGIDALFTGPGGGNPRWKAPLESWFNLLRNRTDHLLEFPGQTGSFSSGLPQPEGLPGLERDTRALVEAARALPLNKAELIQVGLLSHLDAIFGLEKVTELINFRTDHHLEGWRQCGHIITEWRPHVMAPWLSAQELISEKYSAAERSAFAALIAANPDLKRERSLSPAEVWYPRSADLKKLSPHVAAMLMASLEPDAEATVERGTLEVACPELSPDEPLRYGLTRRDGNGLDEPLKTGEKFLIRINRVDPSLCYLYAADGGFAGIASFYGRESRADIQNNHRQFAQKRAWLAGQTADARFLASRVTKADIQRTAHNNRVLESNTGEKAADERTAREALSNIAV